MVMTHAPAPSASLDTIPRHALDAASRDLVDAVLWDLGIDAGHTANGGGVPDVALRLARSSHAAAVIGLQMPPGDELAECALCSLIVPSSSVRECDDGVLRCTTPDITGTTCLAIYLGQ
jgi:hypothetical protein